MERSVMSSGCNAGIHVSALFTMGALLGTLKFQQTAAQSQPCRLQTNHLHDKRTNRTPAISSNRPTHAARAVIGDSRRATVQAALNDEETSRFSQLT